MKNRTFTYMHTIQMTTSHGKLKIYHFFFPMGIPVKKMRDPTEDKFKSGNLMEARDYYREAIICVEDLVDARRKERNDLLIPLYSNLAQAACGAFFGKRCYGRCGNIQVCFRHQGKFGPLLGKMGLN